MQPESRQAGSILKDTLHNTRRASQYMARNPQALPIMQFDDEHIYDAPLQRVETMYFDPAFVPRKYRDLGLQAVEVVSESPGPDMHVTCNLKMQPSVNVPGPLKKFVGGDLIDVQWNDRWNTRTNIGHLDIELRPFPRLKLHCDMSLETHPRGTVNKMHWTVESAKPVIGKIIARFMAEDIRKKSADDLAASKHILDAAY